MFEERGESWSAAAPRDKSRAGEGGRERRTLRVRCCVARETTSRMSAGGIGAIVSLCVLLRREMEE